MGFKITLVLLLCCVMTACQRDMEVTVAQSRGTIILTAVRNGTPACVDEVRIYRANAALDPIWVLAAPEKVPCKSAFQYGTVIPGYVQSGIAPRLQAGVAYTATLSGAGLSGEVRFLKSS